MHILSRSQSQRQARRQWSPRATDGASSGVGVRIFIQEMMLLSDIMFSLKENVCFIYFSTLSQD